MTDWYSDGATIYRAPRAATMRNITPGKRALDLVVTLLLAVLLALPFLLLVLVLLVAEGRPILHFSTRVRAPGRTFQLVKLRSMRPVPGGDGVTGGDKAARISPLQRFLRSSRADELPQLWNVLRGEMSLVGPRPPIPRVVAAHPALYARVLRSRPGITGLATLRFNRHEERILARCRSAAETEAAYARRCVARKARLDLIYQRRRSLWLDLRLICETACLPLRRALAMARPERDHDRTGSVSRRSRPGSAIASATGSRPCHPARVPAASPKPRPRGHRRRAIRPDHPAAAVRSRTAVRAPPPG